MPLNPRMLGGGPSSVGRQKASLAMNTHVEATQLARGGRCDEGRRKKNLAFTCIAWCNIQMFYSLN